jgi:hypothetical protein
MSREKLAEGGALLGCIMFGTLLLVSWYSSGGDFHKEPTKIQQLENQIKGICIEEYPTIFLNK